MVEEKTEKKEKEIRKEKEVVEGKVDVNPSEKEDMEIPIEKEEMPVKRMRTRSMDIAEEESLYSMSRYRISPETIGILNSKGITQLFPIQVQNLIVLFNSQ